jgi:hypothetical protein
MPLLEKITGGEGKAQPSNLNLVPSTTSAVMKDAPADGRAPQENGIRVPELISYISERFQRSLMYRRPYEQLWLQSHRNYRGLYGPDVAFTATEKSRVFIRVTKTKVNAAFGQLMDVLFANNEFPLAIEPERLPEGVVDTESIETNPQAAQLYPGAQQQQQQGQQQAQQNPNTPQSGGQAQPPAAPQPGYVGYPGDGTRPGETAVSHMAEQAFLGDLRPNESVHPGAPITPTAVEIDPALLSAKKMQKKIQDQLRKSSGDKHLRHASFECVNLGTGCVKGPIAVHDIIAALDEQGNEVPVPTKLPKIEAVSIWNIYPDPDARCVEDCDYIVQRHKLSMSQLRNLKMRPGFRENEIDELIMNGFNYLRQWWEPMLQDMPMIQPVEKYEVLEYWGMVDKALLNEFGIKENDIPKELRDADELPCNVWVSGHSILRLIINPFNNGRWPYYLVPYEIQPYTIFGIGVSETMADTQMLMNGFMRLAVDNAVLSGNLVFEVDEASLIPGQDYALYPGKFFRKAGGVQGQAIFPHEFPNTAQANMALYDKARELADEATFPSFTHGNTGINPSLGRTSSGLSMMMGAASVGIRMAIKNFDDYLLSPLGQAMFEFNKLNLDDPELKGNFVIIAGGTDSLMKNEIKSQRLLQMLQMAENPVLAPFMKLPYIIRELARSNDIDPDKATNTEEEAMRTALLMQALNPQPPPGQQQQSSGPNAGKHPAPKPQPEEHPQPGQKGFSANRGNGPAQHASPGQGIS